jgi:glutamate 5-kinase
MVTKLNAAKLCMSKGTDMIIANGSNPSVLYDIVDGKKIGTKFRCKK